MVTRNHVSRVLLAFVAAAAASMSSAQVIYVDDTATGAVDGTSWCDAYVNLQDALRAAAQSGGFVTEIRIADGVCRPDRGVEQTPRDRTATFELTSGITLKGGYAGCGAVDPDQRDIPRYPTVLSGDLGGDDVGDRWDSSRSENSYHVVTGAGADASAVLDGLIITSGRADGTAPHDSGGGLYNDRGSPTVVDCTFTDHWATVYGGGMFNRNQSHPILLRCTFYANSGDYGGGIANESGSGPTLTDCVLSANTVGYHGAGIYNKSDSSPTLSGCSLIGNIAYYSGGGVYSTGGGGPELVNCLIADNHARNGGGLHSSDRAVPVLVHCTLSGNIAQLGGGGLLNAGVAARLTSCILWGNRHGGGTGESAQMYGTGGAIPVISHSCVQGWTGGLGGTGNIGDDPLFVPGPAGCHYLSQTSAGQAVDSPCLDAGSGTAIGSGLDTRTTQGTEGCDTGTADMGYHYPVTRRPLVMGDFNRDGMLDLTDFAEWIECAAGPQSLDRPPCCRIFDFTADADVDLADFAKLQAGLGTR